MNWGAAVLIIAGIGIAAVGITGTQKTVCQALTGGDCSWMPDISTSTSGGNGSSPQVQNNETQGAQNLDTIVNNCKNDPNCLKYYTLAVSDANTYGDDPNEFVRQIAAESAFNPNAKSPAGAEGIAQFMPSTAATLGVNPFDPVKSLEAASQLMGGYENYWTQELSSSAYGFGGNSVEADALSLSSYNYGLGGTQSLAKQYGPDWLSHAPTETQNYVNSILYPNTPMTNINLNK